MSKIAGMTCFLPPSHPCQLLPVAQALALRLCVLHLPVPLPSTFTPSSRGLPSLPAPCPPPGFLLSISQGEGWLETWDLSLQPYVYLYRPNSLKQCLCTAGINYITCLQAPTYPIFIFFAQAPEQLPTHLTQFYEVPRDRR